MVKEKVAGIREGSGEGHEGAECMNKKMAVVGIVVSPSLIHHEMITTLGF